MGIARGRIQRLAVPTILFNIYIYIYIKLTNVIPHEIYTKSTSLVPYNKKKMCLLRYHLFLHWDLNNLDLEEKKSSPFSFSTHQKIGFNVT